MGNTELSLNEKIIALRNKHELSQNKMAEAADIKFRTYQNLEYGRTERISLEDALKLSLAFGISLFEFVESTEYDKYKKVIKNGPSVDPDRQELLNLVLSIDKDLISTAVKALNRVINADAATNEDEVRSTRKND